MPANAPTPFVHLHLHTNFSLLDGACKVGPLVDEAVRHGMPAVAITDHGNLFGAIQFYQTAKKKGIKPILGCEVYVATGARTEKSASTGRKPYHHLILLAENNTGYQNLVKLVSAGYLEGFYYKPRIDKALLRRHREGLIGLSACLGGEVAQHLIHGRREDAATAAREYADILGRESFFLEVQDHGIPEQKLVNEGMLELSKELGIGMVATNDCHFLRRDDHRAHHVLICIGTQHTIHQDHKMKYTEEHYFKDMGEMAQRFAWCPEAVSNSVAIADRCNVELKLGKPHLPHFAVPAGFTLDSYFEAMAREGFEARLPEIRRRIEAGGASEQVYRDRLDLEIRLIQKMEFPGYFLIVWDFIKYAKDHGIPVGPGRGSAAGSLVAWALRITEVDPIHHGLLFERFLNPERISMPDIDIDFCVRGRSRVIDYVVQRYGAENVAQIITFGEMKARLVVRDVARVLGMPVAAADKVAKLIPMELKMTIDRALESNPALKQLHDQDPQVAELLGYARKLEGMTRHAGTHAAGIVISPKPIVEFCPLYRADRKDPDVALDVATQYAMNEVAEVGLIKMDFLGLRNLTILDDCLKAMAAAGLTPPRLDELPMDDPKTFELFQKARTHGVFQFESSGMKDILRRLKPTRFEDLVILNALYRPGPIQSGMVDQFIERRHGKERDPHPIPAVEGILAPTDGVLVYQEQVMQIANRVGGFTMGQSDELRKAMGKKIAEKMNAMKKVFLEGATKLGVNTRHAAEIYDQMGKFAEYGFNKSHSVAYAVVAYQTAYMKANHPTWYMAALISSEMDTTDAVVKYVREAKAMGIEILPPDVNSSGLAFQVEGSAIRFGLLAIRNLGEGAIRAVIEARDAAPGGRFESFRDFVSRIDVRAVNRRALEALIKAGAFDALEPVRNVLFSALDSVLEEAQRAQRDRELGQDNLFGSGPETGAKQPLPAAQPWIEREKLRFEKEALGFYFSGHPLTQYEQEVASYSTHGLHDLATLDLPQSVTVVGLVDKVEHKKSRKDEWYTIATIEDLNGATAEIRIFKNLHAECREWLVEDKAVLVVGKPSYDEERVGVFAEQVMPLEKGKEIYAAGLSMEIPHTMVDDEVLGRMHAILDRHPGDKRVFLNLSRAGRYVVRMRLHSALRVAPRRELISELEELIGDGRVKTLLAPPRKPGKARPHPVQGRDR